MPNVEVVYALPEQQYLLTLTVPEGSTVRDVALASGLDQYVPTLNLHSIKLGIFGQQVAQPETHIVREGDRVELYRPLQADPKAARARRAARHSRD